MSDAIYYSRPSPLEATPIRVAIVISLLAHAALIVQLPSIKLPRFELPDLEKKEERLTVRLAPPFSAPKEQFAPPPPPPPAPAQRARPRPTPPVVALDKPAPAPAPPAAPQATAGDLLAYVDARRLARGDAPEHPEVPAGRPAEDERSRANRIATANIATQRQLTFGYDPARSGGVFTIERLSSDYAEFTFVGWNQDAKRRTKQLIEVRRGNNSNIRLAVVREMIAIIRRYEPVEFSWDSQRLGRAVVLSSLVRDSAGLEDFMLKEFF